MLGLALQYKALKGFISRAADNGWIKNKNDWLPVKENGVFDPFATNAWIPINSILIAAVIGAVSSLILYYVLRRIDISEEVRGLRGVLVMVVSNRVSTWQARRIQPGSSREFGAF